MDDIVRSLEEYSKQTMTINRNIKDLLAILKSYRSNSSLNDFPSMQDSMTKTNNKLESIQSKLASTSLDKTIASLREWISEEQKTIKRKGEEYSDRFIQSLSDNLNNAGFELNGNYPNLQVRNIKVRADPIKLRVSLVYGGDEEKISEIKGFDATAIVNAIKSFYQYLEKINYQKELEAIYSAYIHAARKANKEEGDWIPIIRVMNEYVMLWNSSEHNKAFFVNPSKSSFREIGPYSSRIIFSYALYKILQSNLVAQGKYRLNKKTAIHGAARKWDEHLWIPITQDDVQGENAMYLNFSEVQ